jgi:histidinol-phosphate/aromatic aminotransferase/cobyric acid decarboxylase-like protein
MSESEQYERTKILNAHYENLAFELDDGNQGHFLSGWQCENPYVSDLLASIKNRSNSMDYRKYKYFDEDDELLNKIRGLHSSLDGVSPEAVLCASGSTSLLYSFVTYLKRRGINQIYYIPPIYFTLHIAFELYGICATPVSTQQPFEDEFSMELPDEKASVLFITDPIWYTGTQYSSEIINQISVWQKNTSSIVFVDGSLQYLPWNGIVWENTARLDPSYTFRLLCPSKQLSIHGYRFSYLLLPSSHERSMSWTYANIAGPAAADSIAFAHEAIEAVFDREVPAKLMQLVATRHAYLRTAGTIESDINPVCGYFVFEKIKISLPEDYVMVDGKFFNLSNYPRYNKINLLSPSLRMLGDFIDCA